MPTRTLSCVFAVLAALSSTYTLRAQTAETRVAKTESAASVPDLTGVWNRRGGADTRYLGYGFTAEELPMTPWALEKFKANKPSFGPHMVQDTNDPTYDCFLPGVPRIYVHPAAFEIVQTPGRVLQLFEYDEVVRQIWTDGRGHLKDLDKTELLWMGDPVGHWEGDTLVVDSINFNDKTWIDRAGHPHSEQLHVVERIRRVDHTNLRVDLTIEDPIAYTKPITSQINYQLRADWTLHEHSCKDYPNPNTNP